MCQIVLPEIMTALNKAVYSLTHEEKVSFLNQVLDQVQDSCKEKGKDLGLSLSIDMFLDYLSYGYKE